MIRTAEKLLSEARNWLGTREGSILHHAMVDTFNASFPSYHLSYTEAWCAAGLSAIFLNAHMGELCPIECSVVRMYAKGIRMGLGIITDRLKAAEAAPGDIVFYDWQADGVLDHVGVIERVGEDVYTVIECNMSDMVGRRYINKASACIYAILRPRYDKGLEQEGIAVKYADHKSLAFKHHYLPKVSDYLVLRAGPGTDYQEILRILPGERLTCWGYYGMKGDDLWLYVIHDKSGKKGYCSLYYLRMVAGE